MDNFFVSEFQYTEECIPEYLKRWWRENLIVSYLNSVGFPVFFLDVDHTEKSCLSVSGTSADPAPAAHKSQGQQGN